MKRLLVSILTLLTMLLPLLLVAAGCASTPNMLCVKVIDASTRRPLAGVSTSWQQYFHGYFHLEQEGPMDIPISGNDGLISVGNLHRNWTSIFIFTCPGYSNIYGEYTSRNKMILADKIEYFPAGGLSGQFYLTGNMTSALASNWCFVIPLHKWCKGPVLEKWPSHAPDEQCGVFDPPMPTKVQSVPTIFDSALGQGWVGVPNKGKVFPEKELLLRNQPPKPATWNVASLPSNFIPFGGMNTQAPSALRNYAVSARSEERCGQGKGCRQNQSARNIIIWGFVRGGVALYAECHLPLGAAGVSCGNLPNKR
jgi:hypothetical protein